MAWNVVVNVHVSPLYLVMSSSYFPFIDNQIISSINDRKKGIKLLFIGFHRTLIAPPMINNFLHQQFSKRILHKIMSNLDISIGNQRFSKRLLHKILSNPDHSIADRWFSSLTIFEKVIICIIYPNYDKLHR